MSKYHVLFIAAVTIAAFGQVALKKGAIKASSFFKQYSNIWVLSGYLLLLLSLGMNSLAYRGVPLKIGPVLESLGFLIVPLLSRFFFKERITVSRICGFILIIIGVMVFVT